ncbi:pectin lyase-like [Belonocnema kinseyi]|uniref:pectin lyase-like n=1 Tax=Belonocnema kinseyi TaxID=2817044 RepID=UPI00143CD532|nr:pectin lyase-like [Belonocnema kinseyi]
MKTIFFLILPFLTVVAGDNVYPCKKLHGMSGFAEKGGTTGGSEGPVVYIKNLKELKKYISDTVPRTLVIIANIHSAQKATVMLGANKSIIGSWDANYICNIYLRAGHNSKNIIFQNLFFIHDVRNIGNSDTQLVLDHGERYWVDHCTFDGRKVDKRDLGKLLKVATTDYITISNCKFMNHEYGLILGYPSDDPAGIAENNNYPRLTIMFNYFDNINARAPGLMRFGKFHVFNNYIHNCHLGFTIGLNSKIYSEHNYFSEPPKAAVLDDKGNGFFKDAGSVNMPTKQESKLDTWRPSSDYKYILKTPESSRDFCKQYSGAQSNKLEFPCDK